MAVAFVAVPFTASEYWFNAILIPFLIFSLAALGLNILTGYAGQLSLGTAAFMAVGALRGVQLPAARSRHPGAGHLHPGRAVGGAGGRGVRAALAADRGLLPRRGRRWRRSSSWSGLLTKFRWLSNNSSSGVITAQQLDPVRLRHRHPRCASTCSCWPLSRCWRFVAKNLVRSATGRAWMAVRDMDVAAEVIGIPLMRTKLLAFAVSSFYCGVAGALYAFCYLALGGAGRLLAGPLVPHPVHDHHRRGGQHPRLLPRRRVHPAAADLPRQRAARPGRGCCICRSRTPRCRTSS